MSQAEISGTPYEPRTGQVDDWSTAIYARLRDWAEAKQGVWELWPPGYLVLTITSDLGHVVEPIVLDTAEDELTVTFGYWETHLPEHGSVGSDDTDEDVAATEAKKLVDDWLAGRLLTAIYFDAANKWCGSITVDPDEISDRLRYGAEWIASFEPRRIELRRPRIVEYRRFEIEDGEIQEVT
jgi:hypothetical protein